MKQRRHIASIVGICSVLTVLGGCQKNSNSVKHNDTATIQKPTAQDSSKITTTTSQNTQKLTVGNKCIGCGRCAMLASDTFAMQGGEAQVVSQQHIDETQVQQAISQCPVQAIQIVQA